MSSRLSALAFEDRYWELFERTKDVVFVHDLEGRFTMLNPAGKMALGYGQDEIHEIRMAQLLAEDFTSLMQKLRECAESQTSCCMELEFRTKDGHKVPLEVDLQLRHRDGQPCEVQGIGRDLRERKSLEQQLRQSQRMEAIGQLAGGIAHDFNNVLTVIQGYTELIIGRLEGSEILIRHAEEIRKAAERATGLTRQLLTFSRKQLFQLNVMNLNTVVSNLEEMLRRLIGEDIELVTILHGELDGVEADASQLEQVVMNLAINARDAMPRGGKLTLETRNITLDQGDEHQHLNVPPGRYVVLAVSDTGCGMDEETRARIFEPFFTTKDEGKGTGLGLSTVHNIVKHRGGAIWVYSEPNAGATFKVYLPSVHMAAAREDAAGKQLLGGTETILIAEDDHGVRELLGDMLQSLGYTVLAAQNPREASTIASISIQPIHLLISDVVMPQMSGDELGKLLQSRHPQMKVLLTSGYTDRTIADYVSLDPGCFFLEKPFTLAILAEKVRCVLDGLPP